MSSTSPLVLVTGGSGFIGIAVIQNALQAGYRVRAAVRRDSAAQAIANAPGMKSHTATDALTFVTVPDNTVEGAYLEAVKDCEYIIHLASPIATQPVSLLDTSRPLRKDVAGTRHYMTEDHQAEVLLTMHQG